MIIQYRDHNGPYYLELHALRAPVGNYRDDVTPDVYDSIVEDSVFVFSMENNITLYQLGRSGRHICIEDTPRNRRRYASLQRKAIAAVRAMWADMRPLTCELCGEPAGEGGALCPACVESR